MTGSASPSIPLHLVEAAFPALGLSLPAGVAEALVRHAEEMLRWNRSIRLTAITDPREVVVKHILDSLLLLRFGPFQGRILDVGSGAGYPGIPLAACLPDCRVTLVEAAGKKCAFLSRAVAMLGLKNVEVIHGRIALKGGVVPGLFETVVSRATFPPEEAIPLLAPLVSPGGRLLLMTGPQVESAPPFEGRTMTFDLPYGMGTRTIREVKK